MITLRCTAKATKRFGLTPDEEPLESTGLLGDWYVNLLNWRRLRLVMCVSEKTLLPAIVPARNAEFPARFDVYLLETLIRIGIPASDAEEEALQVRDFRIGRTRSRSVLGVVNEYNHLAGYYLQTMQPGRVAGVLAQTPMSPIGYESPDRLTRQLFAERSPGKDGAG